MSHFEWAILMEQEYRQSGLQHDIHVGDHVSYKDRDGKSMKGMVTFVRCDNYLEVWFGETSERAGGGPMINQWHIHHENLKVIHRAPGHKTSKSPKKKKMKS